MLPRILGSLLWLGVLGACDAYDYVIIGGGTSGLVIANRVSENPDVTVAVIEAGPDGRDFPNITQTDTRTLSYINASIDWQYQSVPQEGLGNRSLLYHSGKVLGGSSAINGMVYIRGDKAEFDAWETLGNEGWNWEALLPHFKRSENFTVPTAAQSAAGATYDENFRGEDGPLVTGFAFELDNSSFFHDSVQAWAQVGLPHNPDLGGGVTRGFNVFPSTLDRDANSREWSARAYYQPIDDRPNLTIIRAIASRILWDETSGSGDVVAAGVEYLDSSNNELCSVSVTREVVVSAGALRSPLVLEASGIGNPNILAQHGIETKVELPGVGEGMQDQQITTGAYSSTHDIAGYIPYATFATANDLFGNESASVAEATDQSIPTWAQRVSDFSHGAISPQILESRFRLQHDLIFKKNITIAEISPGSAPGAVGYVYWALFPFSWGRIHLNTSSAADYPVINPNAIAIDFDVEVLTAAGRLAQKVWTTEPLSDWVADPHALVGPASNATDEEWAEYILASASTNWHVVGTNAMLPRELAGVVDSELRVYGTRNVRVVDASVVPLQMSGHPTATLYALAERAAEIIKAGSV